MLRMVDRNGVEVRCYVVNVYSEGQFYAGEDLGKVLSPFPDAYSNFEAASSLARSWIVQELGKSFLEDYEVIAK